MEFFLDVVIYYFMFYMESLNAQDGFAQTVKNAVMKPVKFEGD